MAKFYQEAEKFINESFHKDTFDPRSTLKIVDLIHEKLIDDESKKDPEYFQQQGGVVHASSLSGCLRGIINGMLGKPETVEEQPRKLGIFKAGNLFEDFIVNTLGERVIETQRQYEYWYKNIKLVGRSDYRMNDDGIIRVGENKSVNSNAFWYRVKEGTLIAWQNQIQLQTYLWLERILDAWECPTCHEVLMTNATEKPVCSKCKAIMFSTPHNKYENPEGMFSYISKDDCTVESCPIKFNQNMIDEIVIPALQIINEGYTAKDPNYAPAPQLAVYNVSKEKYVTNWLCTYCHYHKHCAGMNWEKEAESEVKKKNLELGSSISKTKIKPV